MALFRCLTESSFETLSTYRNYQFCKSLFYREKRNWKPWKHLLSQAVLEMKENKPHTPPDFFSWKMPAWWFKPWGQPKASPQTRSCQHSIAPPPLVLPPQHCWWPIKCPDCFNAQNWCRGNTSGKTSFTKLMCPGCCFPLLLAQRGRNRASPGCGVGHWQPPTMSLLLTPWCLYHTRHLLTLQCSLHLYFPKNHHDQNYHLSDVNYF